MARKFLISIDQIEIYVIIGTYTSKYVDYLRGAPDPEDFLTATDGFLFMQPYGPFDIFDGLNIFLPRLCWDFRSRTGNFMGTPTNDSISTATLSRNRSMQMPRRFRQKIIQ